MTNSAKNKKSFLPRWLLVADESSRNNDNEDCRRLLSSLLLCETNGFDAKTRSEVFFSSSSSSSSSSSRDDAVEMLSSTFAGAFDEDEWEDEEDVAVAKLVALQHAKDFVWEELHTGDWRDANEKWRECEGAVVFEYCRTCVRYAQLRAKREDIGMKYVERVLRRVIKELDVGALLAGEVGGGKTLVKVAETVSATLKEARKMMHAPEKEKRLLSWRFECEDADIRREVDVEEEEEDDDDGKKKRKRDEFEEEEKSVLFPILEKDKGGQPPLKVPKFKKPLSLETFMTQFYLPKKPCAMRRFCTQWPAHEKWKDPSYFLEHFGARAVPVEFGSSYSSQNWRIRVVTFEDFLLKHMMDVESGAYLAQQTLADQFPQLLEDIREPEYIHGCFREEDENEECDAFDQKIAKNFWIGPKNTVSPPHTDPRDNLFVQICGAKHVRLWKPLDTDIDEDETETIKNDDDNKDMNIKRKTTTTTTTTTTMYPYTPSSAENAKLTNTSKAGDISLASFSPRAFPKLYQRPFYDVQLDAGDALFIPRGWWHFVKSVSNSISLSHWW